MKRSLLIIFSCFSFTNCFTQSVVISEVYGGGGNAGATYKNDFIELYNPSAAPISLAGWSVQYATASGSSWQVTNLSGSIAGHSYYLIQEGMGTGGTANLPTPNATGTIGMSATGGKVALLSSTIALTVANPGSSSYIDLVGFGIATFFEGSGSAGSNNSLSIERKAKSSSTSGSMQTGGTDEYAGNGYDSNNNSSDFVTRSPQPQNSLSPAEPDTTPPSFTSSYPQSLNISSTSFDLVVNLDEGGKAYYVVLANGATTPSVTQVKTGHDALGTLVANTGSINVSSASSNFSKTIFGLASNTNYDVYVVAEDVFSNPQTSATLLDVTTNVAASMTPSVSSIVFSGFTKESDQSTPTSFTVSASNLTANVNLNVSENFLISSDDINYSNSFTILSSNLISPQTVYVKFNPSGNLGTLTGVVTLSSQGAVDNMVSLSAVAIDPFNQNFNDPAFLSNSGWTQYSVTGAQVWGSTNFGRTCITGCNNSTADKAAQMNGFSGSSQDNEDWLISPQLDLTAFANYPALSFSTISAFAGDVLQLKYSTDYSGTGNPSTATWISVDGKFPPSNSSTWTTSSSIILPKSIIYVAFVYTSNTTTASRWTLDDWKLEDVSSYINVSYINFSFNEVTAGNFSSSRSFNLMANGYGDISVAVPAAFEVSLDNSTFSSSIEVVQADASAGKTIYVRFAPPSKQLNWMGAVSFAGTGLNNSSGYLSGSSYPKSETFNIATYNMEFFGTDVKGTNGIEFGPTDDALQVANATTVLQTIAADVFAVEEISDDNAFNQLVSNLPGYDKILSDRWSYSWQVPDPNFPPQKTGFIYNTSRVKLVSSRVMFAQLYDEILAGTVSLDNYPTGTSSSFWSSGRLPFMATFDVTINGATRRIRMIDIHAKSASDQQSYDRRAYDANVLLDSLNMYYKNENIILLGDFNDNVFGSITTGAQSSYNSFVDDTDNFKVLTYDLNQSGASTFPSSTSFIDNMIISNELANAYVNNSVTVEDPRNYITNYSNTTSDHLPVSARLLLSNRADQSITFDALVIKTFGDAPFALTGSSSSGLPLVYSSSDPAVVSINGNTLTILKAGTVDITASQSGNPDFDAAADVVQSLTINKANQVITFNTLSSKTLGDIPFNLSATTSSGLAVSYSSTSDKVTINGTQITLVKAGRILITALQPGNVNYNAAASVDQSFCINPPKPTIAIANSNTSAPTLTSSAMSGNQWYLNGVAIPDGTNPSFSATDAGTYKVQVQVNDCISQFSDAKNIVVTSVVEFTENISIYPTPAEDYVFISGAGEISEVRLVDVTGRVGLLSFDRVGDIYRANISGFSRGLYVLLINDDQRIHKLKFVKE